MQSRRLVASSMRNEGPYIVEWLAWNRVIGFSDIVIGSNDSTDGSAGLLTLLAAHGEITFIDNVVTPDQVPQRAFLGKLQQLAIYPEVEWLAVLDADEFLNIHAGAGLLEDLLSLQPEVDIIQLNWAVFGDGGEAGFSDAPVTDRFTQRMPTHHRINAGCKCLTRLPQRFGDIHNHNPVAYRGNTPLSVLSGSGRIWLLPAASKLTAHLQYTSAKDVSFEIAQINHYAIKSRDEYLLRQQRGRGAVAASAGANPRHDERYFTLRAGADLPDLTIHRHREALARESARLMALPGVAGAVALTRQRHREGIAAAARA